MVEDLIKNIFEKKNKHIRAYLNYRSSKKNDKKNRENLITILVV